MNPIRAGWKLLVVAGMSLVYFTDHNSVLFLFGIAGMVVGLLSLCALEEQERHGLDAQLRHELAELRAVIEALRKVGG